MSYHTAVRAYCRRIGRALELPRKQKRRLLDGLARELEERFPAENGLTVEQLCAEVGSPESSARALMECAGEQERARYKLQKKLVRRLVLTAMATALIALIALFIYAEDHQVDHVETTVIQYIEAEK